jgi:hypothetical protein
MPFSIRKIKNGKYEVYNLDTGKVYSKGTSKKRAKSQIRLLHSVSKDKFTRKRKIGGKENLNPLNIPSGFDRRPRPPQPPPPPVNWIQRRRERLIALRQYYDTHFQATIHPEITQDDTPISQQIYKSLDDSSHQMRERFYPFIDHAVDQATFEEIFDWVAGVGELDEINNENPNDIWYQRLNDNNLWNFIIRTLGPLNQENPNLNEVIVCLRNIQENIRASNELEEMELEGRNNESETPNKRRKGGKKIKNKNKNKK